MTTEMQTIAGPNLVHMQALVNKAHTSTCQLLNDVTRQMLKQVGVSPSKLTKLFMDTHV